MAPIQKPGKSKQDYGTPPEFLIAVKRTLGIERFAHDFAADRDNRTAYTHFDEHAYALSIPRWDRTLKTCGGGWGWLNPPFGKIESWARRCYETGQAGGSIALLVPAAVGSNWWRDWVDGKARVLQLNGRLTFVGEIDPYPKDCALVLYGPDQIPGYEVWTWMDLLTDEEKLMAKKRTAKPKKAPKSFKATTKAGKQAEKIAAARASKPKTTKAVRHGEPSMVTTVKPNAHASMSSIPEPSAPDLGPILLPEPDDAVKVLAELAKLNDQALEALARYNAFKDATKQAKEKYDDLAEMVLTRLRVTTHASDLPLFEEREADQSRMETAGAASQDDAGEASGAEDDETPPAVVGEAAGELGPDDAPF